MMPCFDLRLLLVLVVMIWTCLSMSDKVREKVICPYSGYLTCNSGETIRVVDVIYGRVVGRNECEQTPQANCTAPVFCAVSEKSNGRRESNTLYPNYPSEFNVKDPCSGKEMYIIIKYNCGSWRSTQLDGENFALRKPVIQSSTYKSAISSKAVDENTGRNYYECTQTDKTTSPWLRIDLQQRVSVTHVKIFNRKGEEAIRLCGFEIRIGDTTSQNGIHSARCGRLRHIPSDKYDVISCEPPLIGRYVTIVIPGAAKVLTLCEVEVYGTSVLGNLSLTKVQLIGSNLPYEGRVVLHGATFCDPLWSSRDADTTCLQLGYFASKMIGTSFETNVGSTEGNPVVKAFDCKGSEGSLDECSKIGGDAGKTCVARDSVKVRCQPYTRLRRSDIPLEGRVEVLHKGIWGTVCRYNSWSKVNARVVCRELGFYNVKRFYRSKFSSDTLKTWLQNIRCIGDEKSLVFCKHNNWKNINCNHDYDVAVTCSICALPLLEDEAKFPDSIFNASAFRRTKFVPNSGRLYSLQPWCLPDSKLDNKQFLEINLPGIFSLSAVATVGGSLGFVSSYKLKYMVSGYEWLFASVNGEKIIPGNTNNDTHNVIRRELDLPCHAQKLHFIPRKWTGVPCMRVELCGKEIPQCRPPDLTIDHVNSASVKINWNPVTISTTHNNYSVNLLGPKGDKQYSSTTELTSVYINNLLPYRQYTLTVLLVGQECFNKFKKNPITFKTKEDVPTAAPKNIEIKEIQATGFTLAWFPPDVEQQNGVITNYSVCFSNNNRTGTCVNSTDITTEVTSVTVTGLQMATVYYYRVRANTGVGPGPYSENYILVTSSVPTAAPKNIEIKEIQATGFTLAWFPPDVEQQNGVITNYSVCYSNNNRTGTCVNSTDITTEVTSVTVTGLQMATVYYYRVRANNGVGPGPYSKNYILVTSSGALETTENIKITSNSFGIKLHEPQPGFTYIQIILVRLSKAIKPSHPPFSYTSKNISTVNESVDVSRLYVTAVLNVAQFENYKDFIIGDGRNYGRIPRRRRRDDKSETTAFYNRPLESNSFYSAFQRTFQNEEIYHSSSWMEPIKTVIDPAGKSKSKGSDKGIGAWIGIAIGVVVFIVLLLLLVLYFRKRSKLDQACKSTDVDNIGAVDNPINVQEEFNAGSEYIVMDEFDGGGDTDSETDAAGNTEDESFYGNYKATQAKDPFRMVPVDEFENYVRDMKQNDNYGFQQQFKREKTSGKKRYVDCSLSLMDNFTQYNSHNAIIQLGNFTLKWEKEKELPQGVCHSCTIANNPENKPKNRYANIVSYDDASVTLSGGDREKYINASFIQGFEPKSYIATQGPLKTTIPAFWMMVWEQECTVIVMLTNIKEKEKAKCSVYWPKVSEKYGNITVTVENKQLFPYYVVRKFCVIKNGRERCVTQFHFTAWPDHGVPKYPTQLLAFQHCIRMNYVKKGSIIVHCSAGVGRTGTFIAIDHALETLSRQQEGSLDIFFMVQEMRKCRVNMIQTLEQYVLVHDAILESIASGVNEIEGSSLDNVITKLLKTNSLTKQTGFEELFKRLNNFSPVLTKAECKTATLKQNSRKNRTSDIYPADLARVTLSRKLSKKGSDYINATFVDGYKQKNAYIATESPLTNTVDVFWQMILEQQSPLIIMLNDWKEEHETYPVYFPTEKNKSIKYGTVYVRLDECVEDQSITFRKFSLSKTSDFGKESIVRHFHYTKWPKAGVPKATDDILQMINTIQTAQRQNEQGPMVVHCSNGAGRSGSFLTLSISLERLKTEQRVDVFQCIKLAREQRPQFVHNAVQLQFCYEVLANYVKSFEDYSNFVRN